MPMTSYELACWQDVGEHFYEELYYVHTLLFYYYGAESLGFEPAAIPSC